MMQDCKFIGGSRDGEIRRVETVLPVIKVPKPRAASAYWNANDNTPVVVDVEVELYHREEYAAASQTRGEIIYRFKPQG